MTGKDHGSMSKKKKDQPKRGPVTERAELNAERLRDFSQAGSDWFFELDPQLRFTFASDGYSPDSDGQHDSIIGRSFFEIHGAHHLSSEEEKWEQQIADMRAGKNWHDFVYTRINPDGQRRIFCNSGMRFLDRDGRFSGFRGVERDVTGRVTAEAQLHSIINTVPDAIIIIDEKGLVVSFSRYSQRLFGYSETEVIGSNVKMFVPGPDRDKHDAHIARYVETGDKRIIGIGREVEAVRKDGSTFPIHLSVSEMQVGGQRMFTGVVHDISELKSVRSLNQRLGEVLDHSLNEIYLFDAQTLQFVEVNSGGCRNLGYSKQEMLQKTPVDLKPEFSRASFKQLLDPLLQGQQEVKVFQTRHRRRDNTTYPVEVHLQLMGNERPPVFLAIIQDITETMRREAQLRQSQKMEAIGQLTGGIAHDFNNLLTVIIGNNELLSDLIEEELPRALLDDSTGAAEHAAQLTNQLLAFARQQPLAPQLLQLNGLIEQMEEMLSRTLGEQIHLRVKTGPDLWPTLADPAQVHNAILNLSINARDAMPSGGDLVIETSNAEIDSDAASLRDAPAAGRYVRLSVRDTGFGMSPETQARILEPFFTTKDKGKGTGLGLSMVHGFAKQSGGFMEIYSEIGYGTAISFYLPDAGDHDIVDESARAPETMLNSSEKTILVVEDDPRVREITVKRLKHLGYTVVQAESAQQALAILGENENVDLVFSDMIMPGGMTGGELLRLVELDYPNVKRLITSGYAEDGIIPNHGTNWLRKPYSIQEMNGRLRELLGGT